MDGVCLF